MTPSECGEIVFNYFWRPYVLGWLIIFAYNLVKS